MFDRKQAHVEAAKRYAEADKSDPFAFRRAMTHIGSGLTAPLQNGLDVHYDAEQNENKEWINRRRP